jgi:protein phosphatase
MRLTADLEIGVDTHTGRVRTTNEDDYLVYSPDAPAVRAAVGRLVAIADGMGGASGGAEASRTAIRALAASFVEAPGDAPEARMARAFAAACRRLYQLAKEQPRLRDMGTTLTVINLLGDRMVLGHVGDTRCYLLRGETMTQLTQDHAVRRSEHQLVRCIGAGREREDVDIMTHPLNAGDIVLLATDGLWDAVDAKDMQQVVRRLSPQAAAEELVRMAVDAGGVDNSTAVVVAVHGCAPGDAATEVECDLPARERVRLPSVDVALPSLRRPMWPWIVLLLALALAALAVVRFVVGP